jgi:hypothetical protein
LGDFSDGSGRRQCIVTAKSTGKRCGCDAVQGANRCYVHKGIRDARNANPEIIRLDKGQKAREALARIGFGPPPEGLDIGETARGIVARGRLYESYQNRQYAPKLFKEMSLACQINLTYNSKKR